MGLTIKREAVKDDQSDPSERGCDTAAGGKRKPTVLLLKAVNGMIVDVVCGSLGKTDQQIEQQTPEPRNHKNYGLRLQWVFQRPRHLWKLFKHVSGSTPATFVTGTWRCRSC